jgi:tetratricopeptide (TPR) repeat protein
MGAVAAAIGDANMARQWLLESLEIARKIADRTQEILCQGYLGWLSIRLKQPAEASEYLQAALALAERIDSRTEQSWLHSGLAEACRLAGNTDQAQIHAQRALELAQAYGRPYDEKLARQALATL